MTEQDIQAWERELNHAAKMQKQREGWDGRTGTVTFAGGKTYEVPFNHYEIKDDNNDK
ncbi:hypothetical protein ACI2I3_00570 [Psychrobacter namhaensis]|uniref:Uncharacterized protein n=1 Tax=Psychrobacter namhaensis TaxID=292734 RepID=A0ABW8L5V5_9GAMM